MPNKLAANHANLVFGLVALASRPSQTAVAQALLVIASAGTEQTEVSCFRGRPMRIFDAFRWR